MPLGAEQTKTTVNLGDTAELYGYVYDQNDVPIAASLITGVDFTVKKPDGTEDIAPGEVISDGEGFYRYIDTTQKGLHSWTARFTYATGQIKSTQGTFQVVDPFESLVPTQLDQVADEVWMRLEDCFDSQEGGPWLRDMTLRYFNRDKIQRFVQEGIMLINNWPPITQLDVAFFTTPIPATDPVILAEDPNAKQPDPDRIILVQATLLEIIRHLMRSYVEQPAPQGANIVYQDRREYLQRWQTIYEIEWDWYKTMLSLFKRNFLNYGKSALLVSSKAGRLYGGPGFRQRNVMRGYY